MKTAIVQAQQKWECHYVTAYSESALTRTLNEAGAEGWEPFSALQYKDSRGTLAWIVMLKRPSTGQPVVKAPGAATEPGKQPEAVRQPSGFDLEGDTFDIRPEPPEEPTPLPTKPAQPGAAKPSQPAAAPGKAGQPAAAKPGQPAAAPAKPAPPR